MPKMGEPASPRQRAPRPSPVSSLAARRLLSAHSGIIGACVRLGDERAWCTPHRSLNRCCPLIRVKTWFSVFFSFSEVFSVYWELIGLPSALLRLTVASELGPVALCLQEGGACSHVLLFPESSWGT